MNAKYMLWKRAVRVVLFGLLLNVVGMTKGYAYYDFSATCATGQTLYYQITDSINHHVRIVFPGSSTVSAWSGFEKPIGHIVLPDHLRYNETIYTVTAIGFSAFNSCLGLTSVDIPATVNTIGFEAFWGTGWFSEQPDGLLYLDGWCLGYKGEEPTGSLILQGNTRGIADQAFYGCNGLTGNLVLPNSIVGIGNYAFYDCHSLTGDLTLPNSLTTIGEWAFRDCSGFTGDLIIPNSVTTIGEAAFYDCSGFNGCLSIGNSLTTISAGAFTGCSGFTGTLTLGNSVTTIGNRAFLFCSGLTGGLVIPNSVTTIDEAAFYGCSGLTGDLAIPNSLTTIAQATFAGCSGFDGSIFIPNTITSIGDYAFSDCGGFTGSLTIGNSVTTIGKVAFYGCSGLTGNLTIPNSVTEIGYAAFEGCRGFTGDLIIPNSVTMIGESAFRGCSGFTGDLVIPNSVTTIGSYAFYECNGFMGSLTISNSLITIEDRVFLGCSGFTGDLVIPNSVTTIGSYAFYECSGFNGVLTIGNSVTTINSSAFCDCSSFTGDLIIPNSVINIEGHAFWGCSGFTGSLIIGNSVTLIGEHAFRECSGLTGDLIIPNSVTTIGNSAFSACSGLSGDLTIPNSVTSLGNAAFYYCSGFTGALTIPNTVTSIGSNTFNNCTGLTSNLIIPNTVTSIGDYAFTSCSGFTGSLIIPNSVTSIGKSAFNGCSGFNGNLTIGNSVVTIEDEAFYNCRNLTGDLVIPNSVTTIGEDAFNYCRSLTGSLTLGNSLTTIGNGAFYQCYGLTGSLTIPNSVTMIDDYAFCYCRGFEGNLSIGNSVATIGNYAFYNCSGLTGDLALPNSLTRIGHRAFQGCTALTGTLTIPENVTWIGMGCFVSSGFTKVNYNATNCTSMGCDDSSNDCYFVFWQNSNLQEIIIGENVTQIPDYAFGAKTSQFCRLTFLGNKVTRIGTRAFIHDESDDCGLIGDLVIPSSVTEIGDWAFYGCFGITSIHSYGAVPPIMGDDALYEIDYSIPVYIPLCSEEDYRGAYQWSNFTNYWAVLPCAHTFTGNGADNLWSNPDNWHTQPNDSNDIIINANCEMDENVEASRIVINSKGKLVIKSGHTLDINGNENRAEGEIVNLGSAQNLIIEDGGQLFYDKDGLQATVQKKVMPYNNETDGWYLMAYPVVESRTVASYNSMLNGQYDLYYYDEPTMYWINYENEEEDFDVLENGRGYLYGNNCIIPSFETQIGNGYGSLAVSPFYTYYENSISECLFRADELEDKGVKCVPLTSLSWYATNSTGYLQSNISIWMANVSENALSTISHNPSSMTLVYSGAMTPEIGWNEFVFNEDSFTWDGMSNVLVCVQRNNGAWNSQINWRTHDCDFVGMSYLYRDITPYDVLNTTYSMKTSTSRPNTIFKAPGQEGEPITISFTGQLQRGTAQVTIPLSYTESIDYPGYNLVGNPFVHNVISYASENVADGCFRLNETQDDIIVSEISEAHPLKPAEGFFVKATGENASITFNPQAKVKASQSNSIRLEITENGHLVDRLIVKKEGQPLEKLSLKPQRTKLFANKEDKEMAIVSVEANEQAISFKAAHDGTYTLTINADKNEGESLHLIDNLTGEDIDLLAALRQAHGTANYTFEAKTTDDANRFKLVFSVGEDANVDNDKK